MLLFLPLDIHSLKSIGKKFKSQDLLAFAVNFAANTPPNVNAFYYAWGGLTGSFPGTFSFIPYHTKIREYNDIENRALWEYELNLNKKEIHRMLLHLWEMDQTHFDYFFAKENCSYHLLSLLEVARPSLALRSHFTWHALPAETIKPLFQYDLVKKIRYRPSKNEQINQRINKLNDLEREILFDKLGKINSLEKKKFMPEFYKLSKKRQIFLLDTLLYILRGEIDTTENSNIKEKNYDLLIKERLKLPSTKEKFQIEKQSLSPHLGHSPAGITTSLGVSTIGPYLGLIFRPLLHGLLNRNYSYPDNSEFLFSNLDLRYYTEKKKIHIFEYQFLSIISLVPRQLYQPAFSYQIQVGLDTEFRKRREEKNMNGGKDDSLLIDNVVDIEGSNGWTFSLSKKNNASLSFLAGGIYRYAPEREEFKSSLSPMANVILLTKQSKLRAMVSLYYYGYSTFTNSKKIKDEIKIESALRYSIWEKDLEAQAKVLSQKNYSEFSLSLQYMY